MKLEGKIILTWIYGEWGVYYNNVSYGSHGPLFVQPSRLNYTYILYIDIYTLDTFILHSHMHAPGDNARALRSIYPFTY